jgi:hypothetical protein
MQTKQIAGPAVALLLGAATAFAEIKIVIEHNDNDAATAQFKFKRIPAPSKTDAATEAKFAIVDGEEDDNGGSLEKLHDGRVPSEEDEPAENFFFNAGTQGGRILVDLGRVLEIREVNTYSWHPNTRGPQVYTLYASDGKAKEFKTQAKWGVEPEKCGWKPLARVDTRPKEGREGGQYGVSILDSDGSLGKYRYLLFDVARTEADDDFGNTFYSEIDVVEANAPTSRPDAAAAPGKMTCKADGGNYQITIDTSSAPDLTEWAEQELAPTVQEWYPQLVRLLPSDGFEAPKSISIVFRKGRTGVPAATSGASITCNSDWFGQNLKGEAKGAVVHELVHIIQHYHSGQGSDPAAARPAWLVEGIPDYLRWFKYEPQSHGADVAWMRTQQPLSLRYDAGYRISANFLNWVSKKCAPGLVQELNAALRAGNYHEDLWKQRTGRAVQELGDAWKKDVEAQLAVQPAELPSKDAAR